MVEEFDLVEDGGSVEGFGWVDGDGLAEVVLRQICLECERKTRIEVGISGRRLCCRGGREEPRTGGTCLLVELLKRWNDGRFNIDDSTSNYEGTTHD